MTPEREAFMRKMEGNQFFPPDWRKLIECLDGIAELRKERDTWRNQHHALNVDNMELQVQIDETKQKLKRFSKFTSWLRKQIDDEEYYSGSADSGRRLQILREVMRVLNE